jgi:hypothetical protein
LDISYSAWGISTGEGASVPGTAIPSSFLHGVHRAADAADGGNPVALADVGQHALGVLLLFALGADDQEVEDHDDQGESGQHGDHAAAAAGLAGAASGLAHEQGKIGEKVRHWIHPF